jgi:DNA-binding CsgD family transcriptional regulator
MAGAGLRGILDLQSDCELADSLDSLEQALIRHAGLQGLSRVALIIGRAGAGQGEGAVRLHNYPAAWSERIRQKRYLGADPVLRHASCALEGFSWDDQGFTAALGERQRRIISEARAFGIAHGYTVPIVSRCLAPASLSVISETGDIGPPARQWTSLAALIVYRRALHIVRARQTLLSPGGLTKRERVCLTLKARGATDAEIGRALGVSKATASRHIVRARLKLGSRSREQAVLYAATIGEIE